MLKRRPKISTSIEELDRARLATRYAGVDVTHIDELTLRCPCRIAGEIREIRLTRHAGSPSVEVSINDGTGTVVGVFLGRRRLAGLTSGRGVLLEGVPFDDHTRTVILNPTYLLLD